MMKDLGIDSKGRVQYPKVSWYVKSIYGVWLIVQSEFWLDFERLKFNGQDSPKLNTMDFDDQILYVKVWGHSWHIRDTWLVI